MNFQLKWPWIKKSNPIPKKKLNKIELKEGENRYRFFEFRHTITYSDFGMAFYESYHPYGPIESDNGRIGYDYSSNCGDTEGDRCDELSRTYFLHIDENNNKKLCPPKVHYSNDMFINFEMNINNCKICQMIRKLRENKEFEKAKKMMSVNRYVINVIDMNNIDAGMKQLDLSQEIYFAYSNIENDADITDKFGIKGRDIIINYQPKTKVHSPGSRKNYSASKNSEYDVIIKDKKDSPKLPRFLKNSVLDLFEIKESDLLNSPVE